MSVLGSFTKDPSDVLDYVIDWTSFLAGDTISTSSFSSTPNGLTKDSDSNTTTTTTVWYSGGSVGTVYEVTNTVVTSGGRTAERSFKLAVANL